MRCPSEGFEIWIEELKELLAIKAPGYLKMLDEEDWREFYEDGLSPQEAFEEDTKAGL